MTDAFRPDDELVSAVLDGEATPDERARVAADPLLRARLEEFAAVRELIGGPVAPPDQMTKARAIAAAKASRPHPLPPRVVARRRHSEAPRILAVAAAIVFCLAGLGFLVSQVDSSDDSGGDDAAAGSSADETQRGAESSADAPMDAEEGGDTTSAASGEDDGGALSDQVLETDRLGPVADEDALRSTLEQSELADDFASTGDSAETDDVSPLPQPEVAEETAGQSEACQIGLDSVDSALAGLLAKATTEFAGTPAIVYIYGTTPGGQRVIVVSEQGCRVLAAFDL
jgi:hypothetical protein